jgi:ABC-type sugar transport system ATPase subunit
MNVLTVEAARACGLVGELPAGATHVGVRAENVALARPGAVVGDGIGALVEVVEHLGWEALVHLGVGDSRITARVEAAQAPRPGDRVRISLDRLHAFAADGARLAVEPPRRERA